MTENLIFYLYHSRKERAKPLGFLLLHGFLRSHLCRQVNSPRYITDESNWEIVRKDKKGVRKIFTTDYYRKERMLVSEETL
mgnify:CR=1 FL=1